MREFTEKQGELLLSYARAVLAEKLGRPGNIPQLEGSAFNVDRGVFVTLKLAGALRGCIGNIEPVRSVADGVAANTVNAALHDHRFDPLTAGELDRVEISISILTQPEKLYFNDSEELCRSLNIGVDGVILKRGSASATFLPQVWEQLPNTETFLSHLCLKAGIPRDTWKSGDVDIHTYRVQHFGEREK